jgi:hypothetical protein
MISTQGELLGIASELTGEDKAGKSGNRKKTLKHFIFQTLWSAWEEEYFFTISKTARRSSSMVGSSAGRVLERETFLARRASLASMSGMCVIARCG